MTLQQLNYFVVACQHGNISHAAEEFGVSQPSVSAAIKNLENEFGLCLIRRRQTGFILTPDGEEFKKMAERLLEQAESVSRVMTERGKNRPFIRLGVPPMVASILLPALYGEFHAVHPEIEIQMREMGREDLLNALDRDLLDLAFLPHAEAFSSEYQAIPAGRYEIVCCMAKDHPLAEKKQITSEDLAGVPLALFSKSFFRTERIHSFFHTAGIQPEVLHTTSQLSTVEQLITEGVAVGFLFRELMEQSGRFKGIPLSPPIHTDVSLVLRRDRFVSEGMREFMEYIENSFTNL
ncbi:MAG: LysR family transcriptional regulator [Clostridia bacterium]|nr:LysR family transcriptional regulator [Clostridia bacterium]